MLSLVSDRGAFSSLPRVVGVDSGDFAQLDAGKDRHSPAGIFGVRQRARE